MFVRAVLIFTAFSLAAAVKERRIPIDDKLVRQSVKRGGARLADWSGYSPVNLDYYKRSDSLTEPPDDGLSAEEDLEEFSKEKRGGARKWNFYNRYFYKRGGGIKIKSIYNFRL